MRITIDISTEDLVNVLEQTASRLLDDGFRYPCQSIAKAISEGVTKAISDQLPPHSWSDELTAAIGASVAKELATR